MNPQYGKVIQTDVYFDNEVSKTTREIESSVYTDHHNVLKEVIGAMSVLSSGDSNKLTLTIVVDNKKRYRLVSRWVI